VENNQPTGMYMKYLQRLREQAGFCDDAYWQEHKRNRELQQQPRDAA
jgi:hypothetical protein